MGEEYKQASVRNHEEWLAFARKEEPGLRLEDLVLVQRCDRVRSWANAVFDEHNTVAEISLKVDVASIGGAKAVCDLHWETTHGTQSNWGPVPRHHIG